MTRYTDDIFRHIPLIAGIRQSQKGNDGLLNADEGEQVTLPVEKGQKAETQREKAELLLRLQQSGSSLLLPNAWDAASARLFEEAGFPAKRLAAARQELRDHGIYKAMSYEAYRRVEAQALFAPGARRSR